MNAFFSLFDRIRIISLRERADRRRDVEAAFARVNASIDGQHVQFFLADRPAQAADFPSAGARGCFMSHLSLLKDAAATGARRLLILEDDIAFTRDFEARARGLCGEIASRPWSILYGGYALDHPLGPGAAHGVCKADPAMLVLQTHCLAFDAGIIPAVIAHLEAMLERPAGDPAGGPMHVDGAYSWFRRSRPDVATLMVHPPLALQRASKSDIYNEKLMDRLPLVKDAVRLARRLKNRLR